MAWVRIEDNFYDHPKVQAAGSNAAMLFIAGLCYANRHLTDGFVPKKSLSCLIEVQRPSRLGTKLVQVGLWEEVPGGYMIHDYFEYQKSRVEVEAQRDKKAASGLKGAAARWKKPMANAMANAMGQPMANAMANAKPEKMAPAKADAMPPTQPNPRDISTDVLISAVTPIRKSANNEVWDAVVQVCRINVGQVPKTQLGLIGKVVKELTDIGASGQDVFERGAAYRLAYPEAALTVTALLKHWASVEGVASQPKVEKNELEIRKWAGSDQG